MTNFEKIKTDIQEMTVEELAASDYGCVGFHCGKCEYKNIARCQGEDTTCRKQYLKWLKSEVEEC